MKSLGVNYEKENEKSEIMKWTHPGVTLNEVAKNTKEANKAPKPNEKESKVATALANLPAEYRESVKVIMEEVTGKEYNIANGLPNVGTFIVLPSERYEGKICVVRYPRAKVNFAPAQTVYAFNTDRLIVSSLGDDGVVLYGSDRPLDTKWNYLPDAMVDLVVSWFEK